MFNQFANEEVPLYQKGKKERLNFSYSLFVSAEDQALEVFKVDQNLPQVDGEKKYSANCC